MFKLFQLLDQETITRIKKNGVFYILAILLAVIVYQNKQVNTLHEDKNHLYEVIRTKDSIVHQRDQEVIAYYQNFFVETSKMLVMQRAQINKADTIISRLSSPHY